MLLILIILLVGMGLPSLVMGISDGMRWLAVAGAVCLLAGAAIAVIHSRSDEFARTRIIHNEMRMRLLEEENDRLRLRIEGREP